MSIKSVRAAFAHCAFTGISGRHLGLLVTELEPRGHLAVPEFGVFGLVTGVDELQAEAGGVDPGAARVGQAQSINFAVL